MYSEHKTNAFEAFNKIGIKAGNFNRLIQGNICEKPEDFIVREVHKDGTICSTTQENLNFNSLNSEYVHATLVKKNISTFEACHIFCKENHLIYPDDISFCGLKDTNGFTSQLICIKNAKDLLILKTIFENFFVKDFKPSDKKLSTGDHAGNNFIITIRNVNISKNEAMNVLESFASNATKGLPNFYGPQRFGIRQINHILGKILLKKQYEEFILKFLTYSNNEKNEIAELRQKLKDNFGDWKTCLEIIGNSKNLTDEKELVSSLCNGLSFLEAIKKMNLSNFFLHSYSSYLFNLALSGIIARNDTYTSLEKIGNKTDFNETNRTIYEKILAQENISVSDFTNSEFLAYNHIRNTHFYPRDFKFNFESQNIILYFTLNNGEYASLLLNLLIDCDFVKLS